ncbi:glycosyltransferase family 4 protein [Chloroflexota bacterium]
MKIALVSPYDFAHPGGVPSHISQLERKLTGMGNEVKVIAPASRPIDTFDDRFIPIGNPWSIPSSGSIIRVSISLNLGPTIKKVLAREKFDIIHIHEPFMPMLSSAVLRFSDAVNIGTFHASQGRPGYNWGKPISTWMIKRRHHKLHCRIAVSEPALKFAQKNVPPGEYEIIPNGVDIEHFSPDVAPMEEFCDGKQNILFLGRLEHRKGLKYLLEAYKQIKQQMPNTRLIVVGPGTRLRKRYEKWILRNHVEDVVFTGYARYSDLPRYYKTADVYCSPATGRESQGIVLLEGMAVGTPVVASNIEGYAGVITHREDGLLVPPKKSGELANAIITLLRDESLRHQIGEKGKATAAKYSWESVARRVYDCYIKAANSRGINFDTD